MEEAGISAEPITGKDVGAIVRQSGITTDPLLWASRSDNWGKGLKAIADTARQIEAPTFAANIDNWIGAIVSLQDTTRRQALDNPMNPPALPEIPASGLAVGLALTTARLAAQRNLQTSGLQSVYEAPLDMIRGRMKQEATTVNDMRDAIRKKGYGVVLQENAPYLDACARAAHSALVANGGDAETLSSRGKAILALIEEAGVEGLVEGIKSGAKKTVAQMASMQNQLRQSGQRSTQIMQPIPRSMAGSARQTPVPVRAGA